MARILEGLREAETLAEALSDRRRMALASLYLCGSFYAAAEHDRAVAAGERALAHSRSVGAVDLGILAGSNLGQALVARTDYHRATEVLDEVLALLEGPLLHERFDQGTLPSVLVRVNAVRALVERGRFDEAIARGEEAVRIARKVEHPASLLLADWAGGMAHLRRGDAARAIAAFERSLTICREVGLPIFLHWVGPHLGAAYAFAKRVSEALALLDEVLAQDAATGVMSQNTLTVGYLAEAHLLDGHVDEANDHAARALALARDRHERGYQAWIHRLLGAIAEESGDRVAAAASHAEALTLADELGMRPLAAHCHFGLGRLAQRNAGRRAAEEHLTRAAAMYREMDMRFWLTQAEAELAASDAARGSGR
jgi:tetratricopeptide (TPR) repeat protein